MAKEIRLPQLGQTMEEGTIVNCLIKVDDEVKKGDFPGEEYCYRMKPGEPEKLAEKLK